jgi:hypothetical protein
MPKIHFPCIEALIHCQKCNKIVQQSLVTLEDYQRCDLNHIFCTECVEKYHLEDCPVCELPLEFKVKKSFSL